MINKIHFEIYQMLVLLSSLFNDSIGLILRFFSLELKL